MQVYFSEDTLFSNFWKKLGLDSYFWHPLYVKKDDLKDFVKMKDVRHKARTYVLTSLKLHKSVYMLLQVRLTFRLVLKCFGSRLGQPCLVEWSCFFLTYHLISMIIT